MREWMCVKINVKTYLLNFFLSNFEHFLEFLLTFYRQVHLEMNAKDNVSYIKSKLQRARNGASPAAPSLSAGEIKKPVGTSFLDYCRHEPVILFHHLFIGGFGFLVIVVSDNGSRDMVFRLLSS